MTNTEQECYNSQSSGHCSLLIIIVYAVGFFKIFKQNNCKLILSLWWSDNFRSFPHWISLMCNQNIGFKIYPFRLLPWWFLPQVLAYETILNLSFNHLPIRYTNFYQKSGNRYFNTFNIFIKIAYQEKVKFSILPVKPPSRLGEQLINTFWVWLFGSYTLIQQYCHILIHKDVRCNLVKYCGENKRHQVIIQSLLVVQPLCEWSCLQTEKGMVWGHILCDPFWFTLMITNQHYILLNLFPINNGRIC